MHPNRFFFFGLSLAFFVGILPPGALSASGLELEASPQHSSINSNATAAKEVQIGSLAPLRQRDLTSLASLYIGDSSVLSRAHQSTPDNRETQRAGINYFMIESDYGPGFTVLINNSSLQNKIDASLADHALSSESKIRHLLELPAASSTPFVSDAVRAIFKKIDAWLSSGISWEQFKANLANLSSLSDQDVHFLVTSFETLKKYRPVPSEILLDGDPDKIGQYLLSDFAYKTDEKQFGVVDYWQSVEEFIDRKQGDCEDFALLADTLLKINGFSSLILNVYTKDFGHSLTVYKQEGNYRVIDGSKLVHNIQSKSLTTLIRKINPQWDMAAVVKYADTLNRGRILKEIYPPTAEKG